MKKIFKTSALLVALTFSSIMLMAQDQEEFAGIPKWIPEKGYWIIENNMKTPDTAIIHFYNNEGQQVYFEKVQGIKFNLNKRKTLMRLREVLDRALITWDQSHTSKDNAGLVRNVFNR